MRNRKTRAGLTLVEVILAAAILSVGLTVLLTAATRCLAVLKVSGKYQTAQWVLGMGDLENPLRMTEEMTVEDLEVGPVEYTDGYTYERIVEDDEDEDDLYLVRTRVSWADRGREAIEEVLSYVYYLEEDD